MTTQPLLVKSTTFGLSSWLQVKGTELIHASYILGYGNGLDVQSAASLPFVILFF
jgi:hypothetical protein